MLGRRLCTMMGGWRQSDFDSIGEWLAPRSVGLGNLGLNDYDPDDEETGSTSRPTMVNRRPSRRTG